MQNQNRASRNDRAKAGALQTKQARHRASFFREVKVLTVRETPAPYFVFDRPERIFDCWRSAIAHADWYHEDKEHLVSFCMDTKYRLKGFSLVSIGTVNETLAHCREIFRLAVVDAAAFLVVAHNHPSGDPSPSSVDVALARRLCSAGDLLQIPLLDQIVVGGDKYFSFRESSRCWPPRKAKARVLAKQHNKSAPKVRKHDRRKRKPRDRKSKHEKPSSDRNKK